jgi:tRNA (guanine37-N1)-methyltransferase
MTVTVITIFPSLFQGLVSEGIVARAIEKGLVKIEILNLRNFTTDNYKTVDDYPYGGGPGMVMKTEPILKAVASVTGVDYLSGSAAGAMSGTRTVILSPQGRKYDRDLANQLSTCESIILICGRYKAIDDRVVKVLGAEEISIGDYVLSGGELPAMVIMESVVRLIPGAMEDEDSAAGDSFEEGILDCAYYTRPETVAGWKVPEVLLSGNHEAIRTWRKKNCLLRTLERRPDLLETAVLDAEGRKLLSECKRELGSKG